MSMCSWTGPREDPQGRTGLLLPLRVSLYVHKAWHSDRFIYIWRKGQILEVLPLKSS